MVGRIRIILQARTTSQRLPCKVLLPLGGIPLAILCAQRLGQSDAELILATSTDEADDVLVDLAQNRGITVFRGELENVARRFLDCAADLDDNAIIVRATADNPLPNGAIVDLALADFRAAGVVYLGAGSYRGAVPLGLLVEVFTVGALRRVAEGSKDPRVMEHVTPRLAAAANFHMSSTSRFDFADPEPVRVTVDTLDDYLIAAGAFRSVPDPVKADWSRLLENFRILRAKKQGERR